MLLCYCSPNAGREWGNPSLSYCFGQKIERLLLGLPVGFSHWGKPKGSRFFPGFDSSLVGWTEKWFMGSFVSYPSVFYFFIWLFWLKNPKVDAWFFSLPWGKPKGWSFFAWSKNDFWVLFYLILLRDVFDFSFGLWFWRSKKLYFGVFLGLIC